MNLSSAIVFVMMIGLSYAFIAPAQISPAYAESETLKGAKKDLATFKTEMNEKLDAVEKKLEELKNKGDQKSQKAIEELSKTRDELKKEIAELKDDGKDSWKSFKTKLSKGIDSLNSKIQDALKN